MPKSVLSLTHVRITNGVQDGANITVHCKFNDDDFGVHILAFYDTYEGVFHPNIWQPTRYHCQFQWHDPVMV
ncbi:S-protein homolog 5-like protein [Drosera capensis]